MVHFYTFLRSDLLFLLVVFCCFPTESLAAAEGDSLDVSIEDAVNLASQAYANKDYDLTVNLCQQILTGTNDHSSHAWAILAQTYWTIGKYENGAACASKAIALDPTSGVYYSKLAENLMNLNRHAEAEQAFLNALSKPPVADETHLYFGKLLQYYLLQDVKNQGATPEVQKKVSMRSVEQYLLYLERRPKDHGVRNDVGLLLAACGDTEGAIDQYKIAIADGNVFSRANYALLLGNLGRVQESIDEQLNTLDIIRNETSTHFARLRAGLYNNLGTAYEKLDGDKFELEKKSIEMWKHCLEVDPEMIPALDSLANKLGDEGKVEEARELLVRVEASAKKQREYSRAAAARIKRETMLPRIYDNSSEIHQARTKYFGALERLLHDAREGTLRISDPKEAITDIGYNLMFQGFHDNVAHAQYVEMFRLACPFLEYTAPHIVPTKPGEPDALERRMQEPLSPDNPIRIGFYSVYFREHSVGKLMRGVIAELAKLPFFEVVVVISKVSPEDEFTKEILNSANRILKIPTEDYLVIREGIAGLELDVLVWGEVGMAHEGFLLGFSRLAYRQAAFWGHGMTTGLRNMDYFISSALMETPAAQDRFTERLYLMPSISTYFLPPIDPLPGLQPEDFGIPMDYFEKKGHVGDTKPHLYLLPTSLYKMHPWMDEAIMKLLQKDPLGLLLLVRGNRNVWEDKLTRRFYRGMPREVADRIVWLDAMHLDRYLAFMKIGAVIMFTFPTSSGVTTFEALSVNTPYVSYETMKEGVHMQIEKGQFTTLGMNESCCISYSLDEFVDKLYRFGSDTAYRDAISQEIARVKHGRLYQNPDVINDWIYFVHYVSRYPIPGPRRLGTAAILGGRHGGRPHRIL
jgi:predicted O-linked N-acetylglucosamine transferase (SPINDLY family)